MEQGKHAESRENHRGNSPGISPKGRVISYNVSEGERPGGIKVRFKIRIATGKRAKEIDARQAKAIMEVLQWQRQQTHLMTPRRRDRRRGPAEPVPVAFLGRTSTLEMQDPRASLRRQLRSSQEWLPPGLVHRRRLLGRRVRRPGPGGPLPGGRLPAVHRRRDPPRRRPGRPARRSRQPGPEIRRGHLRGHRTLRPRHLQRAEAGKETVPQRDPAVRHRRARPHRRRQRHHRPGPADETRRRGMVPAPAEGENLERAGGAFPGRLEHRHRPLRIPSPTGSRTRSRSRPARAAPRPAWPWTPNAPRSWRRSSPGGPWTSSACPPSPPG